MQVKLLNHTPLYIADKAISKCWAKEKEVCDVKRIERVALKFKHSSTIEHINYTFDIDGVSRALLQELARHRIASYSVKSTRYTLKELKDEAPFADYTLESSNPYDTYNVVEGGYIRAAKYVVLTGNADVDESILFNLEEMRGLLNNGVSNDIAKYCIPEAYKTSLVWTINARSLQNFLALRSSKDALWEIRQLALEVYNQLPDDHKFLFKDFIKDVKWMI